MVESSTITSGGTAVEASRAVTGGAVAFLLGAFVFLVGGAISIVADPPPSTAPVLGMVSHALWALAVTLLALGTATLLRSLATFREGVAGYLAAGSFGLGVLHGLQWLTWAYVDVRAAESGEYDLALETVIEPFGAGHLLAYGVLVGGGIAFLGWAVVRSELHRHRPVGWAGVVVGIAAAITAVISLLAVLSGGGDGHVLFNISTLLLPVGYLWAAILGIVLYAGV
ncbi:hypothetical protein ACYJ1Y_09515 [Natrialbaceae archaeon A-gly3]